MTPRRVFLVGLYGEDNLGDEAIRAAAEHAALQLGSEVHRYATRRSLDDPRAVCVRGAGWRAYLQAIRSADVVAFGGGGLLKDEGHRVIRGYGFLGELIVTALVARAMGRSVVLLAIGVGPVHTRRGRLLVRIVAQLAAVRQVRDEDSAAALRALGVRNVEVTVDPTFTMLARAPETAASAGHAVLSVRGWYMFEPDRERRDGALQACLARAADALAQAGAEIRFANLYWPRDRDAAQEVRERMRFDATSLPGPLGWAELDAQLRPARALVAMRYHAVACAAMAGCPVVPVAYEPKVVSLAEALDLPYVHVDEPDLDARLAELVRSVLARPEAHRSDPARLHELSQAAWAGAARVLG